MQPLLNILIIVHIVQACSQRFHLDGYTSWFLWFKKTFYSFSSLFLSVLFIPSNIFRGSIKTANPSGYGTRDWYLSTTYSQCLITELGLTTWSCIWFSVIYDQTNHWWFLYKRKRIKTYICRLFGRDLHADWKIWKNNTQRLYLNNDVMSWAKAEINLHKINYSTGWESFLLHLELWTG